MNIKRIIAVVIVIAALASYIRDATEKTESFSLGVAITLLGIGGAAGLIWFLEWLWNSKPKTGWYVMLERPEKTPVLFGPFKTSKFAHNERDNEPLIQKYANEGVNSLYVLELEESAIPKSFLRISYNRAPAKKVV